MHPTPDEIEASVWFAWCSAMVFVAGYSLRAPWWKYLEGRALAAHGMAFILLTTPFIVHYVTEVNTGEPWFAWYYIGSFAVAGLVEWWRLWVVWRR
jgi:hypothetical protein